MAKAYLAIVDQLGLRALVPEQEPGLRAVYAVSRRLGGGVCWAVCSENTIRDVSHLLEDAEFSAALSLLLTRAHDLGPMPPHRDVH